MIRPNPRRLAVAFVVAFVIFAAVYTLVFIMPNPQRAAYNWSANTGGLLFFAVIEFVIFGVPLWAAVFAFLSWRAWRRKS